MGGTTITEEVKVLQYYNVWKQKLPLHSSLLTKNDGFRRPFLLDSGAVKIAKEKMKFDER